MSDEEELTQLESEMYEAAQKWLQAKGWKDLGFFPPRTPETARSSQLVIRFTGTPPKR